MIRPQRIDPSRIAPQRIAPPHVPPVVVPPAPFAPTPYLLDFLSTAWNTENGANWQASSLGNWIGAGHVTYDAQTPSNPTWLASLANAEPSRAGDARIEGYINPNSATIQCQIQVFKMDAALQNGYAIIAVWTGATAGTLFLFRAVAGVFSIIGSGAILGVSQIQGVWLNVVEVGLQCLVTAYAKQIGLGWQSIATNLDGSAAALAETKPVWGFTSGGASVPDAQIYHAVKFQGNRDASLYP